MKNLGLPFLVSALIVILTFLVFRDMEMYFSNELHGLSNHKLAFAAASFLILASDIILPVPSSIVMYANGYVLGVIPGSAVSFAALAVGAVIGYFLGRIAFEGFNKEQNPDASRLLAKYGSLAILMTRGVPIVAESICIVCGYNKMPFLQYLSLNIIGFVPLCLLYAFCGSIGYEQSIFLFSFALSIIISGGFWFLGKRFLPENNPDKGKAP
ncbi:MAG: VTT domain-containing protein [Spirochaetia bacterium]|nr:VTT domain-containing protein [Spirochaetia bacterium]